MYLRSVENIAERRFIGELLLPFKPLENLSTVEWGRSRRNITSDESSFGVGIFEPLAVPYMEYVYICLDNPYIPNIVSMKSARIGWTEIINTYTGKRIELQPTTMFMGFPTGGATRKFASKKWKLFLQNTPELSKIINVGVAKNKESMFQFFFQGGSLDLGTLGAIANQKSDNIPFIVVEEPDDAPDDVAGQGDSFENLKERQKTVPTTMKKFIFGGTGTNKDFSRVEAALKASNLMIFKACCHACNNLVPMDHTSFQNLFYLEYPDKYIDPVYGKYNPESAYFLCPFCKEEWSFEQKFKNIEEGKNFGFIDHTGNHSLGWHPKSPQVKDTFGFHFSEMMAISEDGSGFIELAKGKIKADIAFAKGNEAPRKSFVNNRMGTTYASGISSLEADGMKELRINYQEGIIPHEGLIPFMGIDVQHNRFAIVQIAAGRNGNTWLIKWFEIFGDVLIWDSPVWRKLTEILLAGIPHVDGKQLVIEATSIDCQDGNTAEVVYKWCKLMTEEHKKIVLATRGCKELKFSHDEIYQEPNIITSETKEVKSLAETMGVQVYKLGTHRCQDEILRRIGLNLQKDEEGRVISQHDVFYFNEQSYGGYEEQMTACRKIIEVKNNSSVKEVYRLIPGKHMDAMAATKNAFHAMYYSRVREFTNAHWEQLEEYIYNK